MLKFDSDVFARFSFALFIFKQYISLSLFFFFRFTYPSMDQLSETIPIVLQHFKYVCKKELLNDIGFTL